MSKIYEALKKAEEERKKKVERLDIPVVQRGEKEGVEDKKVVARTEPIRIKEEKVHDHRVSDLIVALKDPFSQSAEQFKKVCVRLVQQAQQGKRVLLVTSALPGEGKTMAAANIAISLARLPNTYAILLDADMRKADLHKILGVSVNKGLWDYLEDEVDISEIAYATPVPRLALIPAGDGRSDPREVVSSERIQKLIEELKTNYPTRYVVVDTSPLLLSSEPEVLLTQADSVVMIACYGKTNRENLRKALALLDAKKSLGLIFNRVDVSSITHRHGYHKYHRYGTQRGKKRS